MRTKFSRKKKLNEEMGLQITSMADIFIIILVFLLKSYSTSIANLSPTGEMSLPEGSSEEKVKDTLKLEVTSDAVIVDQQEITKLKNFEFINARGEDTEGDADVLKVLQAQRKLLPEPNTDSTLLVMADEKVPYSTLKRILASAATAGFVDLQLVVVKPE